MRPTAGAVSVRDDGARHCLVNSTETEKLQLASARRNRRLSSTEPVGGPVRGSISQRAPINTRSSIVRDVHRTDARMPDSVTTSSIEALVEAYLRDVDSMQFADALTMLPHTDSQRSLERLGTSAVPALSRRLVAVAKYRDPDKRYYHRVALVSLLHLIPGEAQKPLLVEMGEWRRK